MHSFQPFVDWRILLLLLVPNYFLFSGDISVVVSGTIVVLCAMVNLLSC